MGLYSDTIYSVTTYEELEECKERKNQAIEAHQKAMKNYLLTCIDKAGMYNKVKIKNTDVVGVLKVVTTANLMYPYEIKFYPLKKDGEVSQNSRYNPKFRSWDMKNMLENLIGAYEVVGE